jgi:nicotinate-nucleotide pyrophosphorylase (carboxylating)
MPEAYAPAGEDLAETVARALAEDVGAGDVTTQATVPEGARGTAVIVQKEPGVIYGLQVAELTFRGMDADVGLERRAPEGEWREGGDVLVAEGSAAALLAAERTALNFLGHLSGIATLTARYVQAVGRSGVQILSIRKTIPGLRALERAAVRAGGGANHRAGLYDAVLIKENHAAMAGGLGEAMRRARAAAPEAPLQAECRSPGEIEEALEAGADRLVLDNMSPEALRAAVEQVGERASLEATGGITLETIRDYASTGVQFISIGALTHSAPALDLSLTLRPLA